MPGVQGSTPKEIPSRSGRIQRILSSSEITRKFSEHFLEISEFLGSSRHDSLSSKRFFSLPLCRGSCEEQNLLQKGWQND